MALPEANLICSICGSYEHTLFPVMRGKYVGENVCSSCNQKTWHNPNLEMKRTRWNNKIQDYVEIGHKH